MNTTISISEEMRDILQEFGTKGETYDDILKRLYSHIRKNQIQQILMDDKNTVPVKDALKRAKTRWQK